MLHSSQPATVAHTTKTRTTVGNLVCITSFLLSSSFPLLCLFTRLVDNGNGTYAPPRLETLSSELPRRGSGISSLTTPSRILAHVELDDERTL
ncbi:hypothetical protein FRB91_004878 [Serendipita sp. 411]|nr:hypothetical protein FRB91_004878 [Serendipita sp. 411]